MYDDDVEIDDRRCPFCGHGYTYRRECNEIGCEDGFIDAYDEDPINFAPGEEYERCPECHGRGYFHWCPACGKDIVDGRDRNPDECPNCGGDGVRQASGLSYVCRECGSIWSVAIPAQAAAQPAR